MASCVHKMGTETNLGSDIALAFFFVNWWWRRSLLPDLAVDAVRQLVQDEFAQAVVHVVHLQDSSSLLPQGPLATLVVVAVPMKDVLQVALDRLPLLELALKSLH